MTQPQQPHRAQQPGTQGTVRKTVRIPEVTEARALFWTDRINNSSTQSFSFNDFVTQALENEIARLSGVVVDAENMVTGRLNQLVDANQALVGEVISLRRIIESSYASIMQLGQGDSILTDDPLPGGPGMRSVAALSEQAGLSDGEPGEQSDVRDQE